MINHKVISAKDFYYDGNDCRVYECVTLIKATESHYIVLHSTKVIGWCADEYSTISTFEDEFKAQEYFESISR